MSPAAKKPPEDAPVEEAPAAEAEEEKDPAPITESRWAEIKLRRSQQDFNDLLDALGPDGDKLSIVSDDTEDAIPAQTPAVPPTEATDEAEEKDES